jgi:hypothetical protein
MSNVQPPEYLKNFYTQSRALGDKAISSDATFEPVGFESLYLLIKQFPWPVVAPQGEIEVAMPLGSAAWMAQQVRTNHQGQIALTETKTGAVDRFLREVVARNGGRFDAVVYEGTPDRFVRGVRIRDAFFQADNPDRDWENRSQIVLITGTLFFHYFGETVPGNAPAV